MSKEVFIILAAGRHLHEQFSINDTVSRWITMFSSETQKFIVVTNRKQKIKQFNENVHFLEVSSDNVDQSGSAKSLFLALEELDILKWKYDRLLITYGDTLFRKDAVDSILLNKKDCAVFVANLPNDTTNREFAICSQGFVRSAGVIPKSIATHLFPGVITLNFETKNVLIDFYKKKSKSILAETVSDLINFLILSDVSVEYIDVFDDWCQLDSDDDIVSFILGSKGETLLRLKNIVKRSKIPQLYLVGYRSWTKLGNEIVSNILNKTDGKTKFAVRSSSTMEDAFTQSNAGAFHSELNVTRNGLDESINKVFHSYPKVDDAEHVIVQDMAKDIIVSGVLFTKSLAEGSPYWVLNYSKSGRTDDITSGASDESMETELSYHGKSIKNAGSWKENLYNAVYEIIELLHFDCLDIEFAVNSKLEIVLLQVRPLIVSRLSDNLLNNIKNNIASERERFNNLLHQNNLSVTKGSIVFGVMPDWNPAEIIGRKPSNLTYSLYSKLIMNNTWARQRYEFGYQDLRAHELMYSFGGTPFVNVRASIESFIPKTLSHNEVKLISDICIKKLLKFPELHDKLEFEIIHTCLTFDFEDWVSDLEIKDEPELIGKIKNGLQNVNSYAIENHMHFQDTVAKLDDELPLSYDCDDLPDSQIQECIEFGTLPFAHLARCGFIAVHLLKSAVNKNILSQNAYDEFMLSLNTVSKELTEDAISVRKGDLHRQRFIDKYGHLRQGTYDITQDCYSSNIEKYLLPIIEKETKCSQHTSNFWNAEKGQFFKACRNELNLNFSDSELERFLYSSIEGRENSKFIFTKRLSQFLETIRNIGKKLNLSSDEIQHLSLDDVNFFNANQHLDLHKTIQNKIINAKELAEINKHIELPDLLSCSDNFIGFTLPLGTPNYIGKNLVKAEIVFLNTSDESKTITGKIVLIESADPGYDWVFGHSPAGLITMYGGANSHMAIRAAELGLPSVIGMGRKAFEIIAKAKEIEIDCLNKKVVTN